MIGESEDGASALQAALSLRPDVVLMDVQLPDFTGFAVTRRLLAEVPAAVVLVSTRDASDYGDEIDSSGAAGFVPKAELSGVRIRQLVGDRENVAVEPSSELSGSLGLDDGSSGQAP